MLDDEEFRFTGVDVCDPLDTGKKDPTTVLGSPQGLSHLVNLMVDSVIRHQPDNLELFLAELAESEVNRRTVCHIQHGEDPNKGEQTVEGCWVPMNSQEALHAMDSKKKYSPLVRFQTCDIIHDATKDLIFRKKKKVVKFCRAGSWSRPPSFVQHSPPDRYSCAPTSRSARRPFKVPVKTILKSSAPPTVASKEDASKPPDEEPKLGMKRKLIPCKQHETECSGHRRHTGQPIREMAWEANGRNRRYDPAMTPIGYVNVAWPPYYDDEDPKYRCVTHATELGTLRGVSSFWWKIFTGWKPAKPPRRVRTPPPSPCPVSPPPPEVDGEEEYRKRVLDEAYWRRRLKNMQGLKKLIDWETYRVDEKSEIPKFSKADVPDWSILKYSKNLPPPAPKVERSMQTDYCQECPDARLQRGRLLGDPCYTPRLPPVRERLPMDWGFLFAQGPQKDPGSKIKWLGDDHFKEVEKPPKPVKLFPPFPPPEEEFEHETPEPDRPDIVPEEVKYREDLDKWVWVPGKEKWYRGELPTCYLEPDEPDSLPKNKDATCHKFLKPDEPDEFPTEVEYIEYAKKWVWMPGMDEWYRGDAISKPMPKDTIDTHTSPFYEEKKKAKKHVAVPEKHTHGEEEGENGHTPADEIAGTTASGEFTTQGKHSEESRATSPEVVPTEVFGEEGDTTPQPRDDADADEPAPEEGAQDEEAPGEAAPEEGASGEAAPEEGAQDEEAPEEAAPEEGAPEEAAPEEGAQDEGAPEEAAPEEGAPEEAAPEEGAPEEAAPEETEPEEEAPEEPPPEE